MKPIKRLKGHSGASVVLYDNNTVVKSNYAKAEASAEILEKLPFNSPKILKVSSSSIVMEYINGEDIYLYLSRYGSLAIDSLISFISNYFDWCLLHSTKYNFEKEVLEKSLNIGFNGSFCTNMPKSLIHGDFTLENIIHKEGKFYLIDANPTELSSIHFDACKLRQDLDSFWFLREKRDSLNHEIACRKISEELKSKYLFMKNNSVYSFMLHRIIPYCNPQTHSFITKEILKWQ